MQSNVPVLVPCPDYEINHVRAALEAVLAPLGGLDWVVPGMTVGIKLNLCAAMKPETAATTHPALAAELTRMLTARGAKVILGDSPGGPFTGAVMNRTYHICGLDACAEAGGQLNQDYSETEAVFPQGVSVKSFPYTAWLSRCDAIISFCKLKSHGLMGMTAAVKNLYGVIPGTQKSEFHFRHTAPTDFANLLVDLNEYVKPRLCLCDAVEIMEGNGPTKGTPRHMGLLLASRSAYTLDQLGAALLGVRESEIPYLTAARNRGLTCDLDYRAMAKDWALGDFVRSGATSSWFSPADGDKGLRKIGKQVFAAAMRSKPRADSSCTGCGKCMRDCPAKAITLRNKKAVIDRSKCIRCFCCQEFCPTGAMKAERSVIAKMVSKL